MNDVESKPETTSVSESAAVATERQRRWKRSHYRLPHDAHARLRLLERAVSTLGSRTIDRRTKTGWALASWRDDLASNLGGVEALSTQQRALLDEAVKLTLMLDSVNTWAARATEPDRQAQAGTAARRRGDVTDLQTSLATHGTDSHRFTLTRLIFDTGRRPYEPTHT